MIVGKEHYIQSKWLNGLGETFQLTIQPQGADFKQQQFEYRISVATLAVGPSQFSLLPNHHRWLLILQGGPVTVKDLTTNTDYQLQPQQKVIDFDGAHNMMSDAESGGKDFNLMVRKDRKGGVKLHHILGNTAIELAGEANFIYNCSRSQLLLKMENEEWKLQQGQLFQAPKGTSLEVQAQPNTTFIHCFVL